MMTSAILISNRIARAVIVLTGLGLAGTAMADEVNQVAVYGEVAPRCWVSQPMKIAAANVAVHVMPARAVCNQARPVLLTEVRMIDSDGAVIRREPATIDRAGPISPRTALEIVVTPQL